MTKHRLFIVWGYTRWGGAQSYALAIAKRASPEWSVTFVVPETSDAELLERIRSTGSQVCYVRSSFDGEPAPKLVGKLTRQYRRLRNQFHLLRILSRERIQGSVVQIEAAPWQDWLLLWVLCRRGAAVFVTIHNMFETRSFVRSAVWRARFGLLSRLQGLHFFVTSRYSLDALGKWLTRGQLERTQITYPGMDGASMDQILGEPSPRSELRSLLNVDADAVVVLTVGQFVDRKGPWVLLEAAREVVKAVPDVVFIWIAPNPITQAENDKIAGYGLGGNFRLVDSRLLGDGHSSILRSYRMADVFVLPSLLEGFPIALAEAMSAGLPCISTRVQGIPEAISDGETGILVDAGSSSALALAVVKLVTDRSLAKNLGESAARRAMTEFDEAKTAQEIISAYELALGK